MTASRRRWATGEKVIETTLRAPIQPASLRRVHALLNRLWAYQPDVDVQDRMLFATAVAEVATNIIKHRPPGPEGSMIVTLRIQDDRIEADFTDDGIALDICIPGDPPSDGLAESGRGLALARASLDELTYQRIDGSNRWHLVRGRSGVAD